jgi:hypothetical protein
MIEYASGGPTGYLFRAKARGFNALKTKTWKRGQQKFDCMPPSMSPLPVMALRLLPSIALSSRLVARGYHGAMKLQEDFDIEVSKQAARKSPKSRNTGMHFPLKKSSSVV